MWKHASLSRVLFSPPLHRLFPNARGRKCYSIVSRKAIASRNTHRFRARFFIRTIPLLLFFCFVFFLSLSPVIAAIYYNRGIIAKMRYFKYHTLGGIGGKFKAVICGNTPPTGGLHSFRFPGKFLDCFCHR